MNAEQSGHLPIALAPTGQSFRTGLGCSLADHSRPRRARTVVNRTSAPGAGMISQAAAEAGAEALASGGESDRQVAGLLGVHAERMRVQRREGKLKRQFASAHPSVPTVSVPALACLLYTSPSPRDRTR